jgi:hypothetical protein
MKREAKQLTTWAKHQREHRFKLRLTQAEYGQIWGVSRAQVGAFESTSPAPGAILTQRHSDAFGIDLSNWLDIRATVEPAVPPEMPKPKIEPLATVLPMPQHNVIQFSSLKRSC